MNLKQVISYTTRPRDRKSEKNDSDHIFIRDSDVEKYQNDIAAYTEINGYKYFATYDMIDHSDIYVIDPIGVDDLKSKCGDKYDFVEIYIRIPKKLAEIRSKLRGDKMGTFMKRYEKEDKQFTEYEKKHTFRFNLSNDRPFEESVEKICGWIRKVLKERENVNAT